jgi:hypothetical protein
MATTYKNRGAGAVSPAMEGVEPLGTVRRSQLVSTYGIGAILDLDKGSYMPMGLEDWESATRLPSLSITESRLQAQLGVSHFRLPPVARQIPGGASVERKSVIPAVRFPAWNECPKCHRIGTESDPFELAADGSTLKCSACRVTTTPVRFVVACRQGHIDEFPWVWWAHRKHAGGTCPAPRLKLLSHGKSAALGDMYLQCTCGAASSLGDAFSDDALGAATCRGAMPWLYSRDADCKADPRVLQRGASNVHFPVVASGLSIPPVSEAAFQILEELWDIVSAVPAEALAPVMQGYAKKFGVAQEALLMAWREKKKIEEPGEEVTQASSRAEEYAALSADRDDAIIGGYIPHFRNAVAPPPDALTGWFDLVGAVSRLREVRAIAGFTRIDPYPVNNEGIARAILERRIAPVSKRPPQWLPAAEILGEGIFLRFRTEAIDRWTGENPGLERRVAALEAKSAQVAADRGYQRDYTITARLLLVHSFAHALVRQISVDCGYSSSALRERLYIADASEGAGPMNGVLIYTGSPDSEGSLGGLVRLADAALLERIVLQTIRSLQWCGSDPVCLETDPQQSGDRVSGAACHCCLLVPETACEKFNRELDRTVLVGDADGQWTGFFAGAEDEWQR